MKICLADKMCRVVHKDYLGFPGTNPHIQIVPFDEADFIWYCAMGDGDDLRHDLGATQVNGKQLISVTLGDGDYRDSLMPTNLKLHFSTSTDDWERCVPYLYDKTIWISEPERLACFVGSFLTNPARECIKPLASEDVLIRDVDWWHAPESDHFWLKIEYLKAMDTSKFTLCPRGIGRSSMRLTEAIMCGSIPIMIDDKTRLFGQDLGEFALWSGMNTQDIAFALETARNMPYDEYRRRLKLMLEFRKKYLLRDREAGCEGTLGFTEYIREMVEG